MRTEKASWRIYNGRRTSFVKFATEVCAGIACGFLVLFGVTSEVIGSELRLLCSVTVSGVTASGDKLEFSNHITFAIDFDHHRVFVRELSDKNPMVKLKVSGRHIEISINTDSGSAFDYKINRQNLSITAHERVGVIYRGGGQCVPFGSSPRQDERQQVEQVIYLICGNHSVMVNLASNSLMLDGYWPYQGSVRITDDAITWQHENRDFTFSDSIDRHSGLFVIAQERGTCQKIDGKRKF